MNEPYSHPRPPYPSNFRSNENTITSFDGLPNEIAKTPIQAQARSTRLQSISVAPIRSLSIRQPPHYPSESNLQDESNQARPHIARRVTSTTINQTIQRLEDLLDQAVQLAQMVTEDEMVDSEAATTSQPAQPTPPAQRAQRAQPTQMIRPSAGIRSRVATIIQGAHVVFQDGSVHRKKSQRRVNFAEEASHTSKTVALRDKHVADALRACGPAHEADAGSKSSPAPATMSSLNDEFELKPISPRKRIKSRFVEDLEPAAPLPAVKPLKDPQELLSRRSSASSTSLSKKDIRQHMKIYREPPIGPRIGSVQSRDFTTNNEQNFSGLPPALKDNRLAVPQINIKEEDKDDDPPPDLPRMGHERHFTQMFGVNSRQGSIDFAHPVRSQTQKVDLKRHRHVDLPEKADEFDVHESCQHAPVARDWPSSRKRFAATIACINTACLGMTIGIYAGEVPAIQYVIADFHHYAILGNVFLYCGLAIPTFFLWPLPLLHGRKPYTVASLALALCLQIPQGVAVNTFRSPNIRTWRMLLLLSRALSGFAFGFANINLQASLLDLFGASLQSNNPHQELADLYDVRRHGGGMGLWLGIWSWCSIGSISIGFLVGTFIISGTNVTWGFWTCLMLLMIALLLNVIAPELRRSAFRRTISEMQGEGGDFSRIARGEVKMHLKATGPYWWGEEVKAGVELSWLMMKQPGFLILAVYAAWVYAQFTMVMMFLAALTSTYYKFRPIQVGLCVLSLGMGALFATPFQKASWLSRARYHPPRTDSMSFKTSVSWSSHLLRRTLFTAMLPLAAIGYTLTLKGPPVPIAAPCIFAGLVGFFSNMAIAECHGLIMETFDTSDLQAGMTGRPARKSVAERFKSQRTNFSCYPRVSAGFAVTQTLKFTFGAAATGLCGRLERRVGAMHATGIVAGALLLLTLFLTIVLFRWKTVKMIPDSRQVTDILTRQTTTWEPVILGKPSGTTRKISILEAGRQTRWSEIRKRNRLNTGLEEEVQ